MAVTAAREKFTNGGRTLKMRACSARALHPRVADRLDDIGLGLLEQTERDVARARLSRRQHDRRAAHREGERTQRRALHEGASFDGCHQTFSPLAALRVRRVERSISPTMACHP